jgi:hypothetical protein
VARGFALEPGFEVDPLDAAILNLKVLAGLPSSAAGPPGSASGGAMDRVLDSSLSLAGWTAYGIGPAKSSDPKAHSTLRFGATRLPGPFATLKDLRAALSRQP